jgi:hypothetical protein
VGEHSGPGRREGDKIIYSEVLFTKLLERARLSGGWGELESRFDPSEGCSAGSLVNRSPFWCRVVARALPQAAQGFALVVRSNDAWRVWLSHRSLRSDETGSPL